MLRGTDANTSIRSMRELWEQTRLRAESARPAAKSVVVKAGVPVPWLDVLQEIVSIGYGRKREPRFLDDRWVQSARRTCPSAGALYPVEVIVGIPAHHSGGGNYLFDLDEGLIPYGSPALTRGDLARFELEGLPAHTIEAVIFLLARPWISMAKYGLRGYIYCHLDAGHAASNLAIYARALGATTRTHVRFSRTAVTESLQLADSCREPLIALSLVKQQAGVDTGHAAPDALRAPAMHAHSDAFAARLETPSPEEQLNWLRFNAITSCGVQQSTSGRAPDAISIGNDPCSSVRRIALPEPARFPLAVADVRAAILRRRSAKGFEDAAIHIDQVSTLLANVSSDATSDCRITTAGLRLTLLARAIRDLRPGAYSCELGGHCLQVRNAAAAALDFHAACMGQTLACTAAALLLFHVPLGSLFARIGTMALAESHFLAAQLAQQLYLTAAWLDIGITCIGGFDEIRLAALANLPVREEIIYVAALGVANDRGDKEDRLDVAFSHGFERIDDSRRT